MKLSTRVNPLRSESRSHNHVLKYSARLEGLMAQVCLLSEWFVDLLGRPCAAWTRQGHSDLRGQRAELVVDLVSPVLFSEE